MRRLLIATTNPNKLREIRPLLRGLPIEPRHTRRLPSYRGTRRDRPLLLGERANQSVGIRGGQRAANGRGRLRPRD